MYLGRKNHLFFLGTALLSVLHLVRKCWNADRFIFINFIPCWLFSHCDPKTFVAPSCWKPEKSTSVIPDDPGREAESTHFSLPALLDGLLHPRRECVHVKLFWFCGLAFSSSCSLTCDLKQALDRKQNSSSSMNLPIILSKIRNSKCSVILLSTQISVISSWTSKYFQGSKEAYIMHFIFI